MTRIAAVEGSQDTDITIEAIGLQRTVLFETPTVALVLRSVVGEKFMGHLELTPTSAQILGEEIRKAAEAAQTTLEEEN